jgi:hypothetical protein
MPRGIAVPCALPDGDFDKLICSTNIQLGTLAPDCVFFAAEGWCMAKPNYSFEKRQRELAKKKKKEEKLKDKAARKPGQDPEADAADAAEAAAEAALEAGEGAPDAPAAGSNP